MSNSRTMHRPRPKVVDAADRHLWRPWTPINRAAAPMIVRGRGYHVWDADGNRYIDAISSSMNSTCGYGHPILLQAARGQLEQLPHYDLTVASNPPAAELARRLSDLLPAALTRTLFVNSGSEATEAAVNIALAHLRAAGSQRSQFISFERGYHGSTALAQALSGLTPTRQDLQPPVHVRRVRLPIEPRRLRGRDSAAQLAAAFRAEIQAAGPEDIAAVIVEPFLNVGGAIVLPAGFLRELRELCDECGALLILDEVFTGFGRSGRMFGLDQDAIQPDMVLLSKGISSGYIPLAAVVTTERIYGSLATDAPFGGVRYGHTTSGHAAACAVGLAVLDVMHDEQLAARSAHIGKRLIDRLEPLRDEPAIIDLRAYGSVVAIETVEPLAQHVIAAARDRGILLRQQGAVVMAVPPLILDDTGVEELGDGMLAAARQALAVRAPFSSSTA